MTQRAPRVALFLALVAAAGWLLHAGPTAAADPIRVGYMGPLSGIFAQAGKDMLASRRTSTP